MDRDFFEQLRAKAKADEPVECKPEPESLGVRERLLAEAASKPVRTFVQIDAVTDSEYDCTFRPDEDGDSFCALLKEELRNSDFPLRVQVAEGTSPEDVLRLLRKIAAWIERRPSVVEVGSYQRTSPCDPA